MIDTHLGLQRRYETFATKETSLAFFRGLGDYIDYVMSIPRLSSILKAQLDIREIECKKVKALEKEAVMELEKAKEKLLKIIERNKIDPKTLNQDTSFIPTLSWKGGDKNILEHLKMFETGEVVISGFYSDNLQKFLFDIAAGLLYLGHKDELKEFIVKPEEYGEYYDTINGYDKSLRFGGNTRGNFIFSETWPKRFEQSRMIDAAREIEPWGAFEALVKFWKTRKEVAAGKVWDTALPDISGDTQFHFDTKDSVDILFGIEDFKIIQANPRVTEREIHYLHLEKFRTKIATAHWFLSRSLEDDKDSNTSFKAQTTALENQIEKAWRGDVDAFMKETREFMNKYNADRLENQNLRQSAAGGKWWKDGERPIYDEKDKKISLGGKEYQVPLTAINRIVLCDAIFSSTYGSWIEENDVISKFRGGDRKSRSFYDAVRAINASIESELGIVEILEYKASKVRINKDIFEKKM